MLHLNVLPFLRFCDNPVPAYKEFVGIVLPLCDNGRADAYCRRYADVEPLRIVSAQPSLPLCIIEDIN